MPESGMDADVIVIGGGMAGMVAANRLGQLGKRVIVLEKGRDELYPCNARWSGGTIHVHYTDPMAPKETLRAAIEKSTEGFTVPELGDALAGDVGRLVRWLKSEGIRMVSLGGYHTSILAPPAGTAPGLAWRGQGGDVTLQRLEANLKERNGYILRGARAEDVEPVAGGMRVTAATETGPKVLTARDVIIADGGFPANRELIAQYISPHPDKILQRNAGSATGDGLRIAQKLGAGLTGGMDCFYGHLLSRDAMTNEKLWPRPYLDSVVTAAIVVDGAGRRFADEGNGGVYMANAVARLDDPLSTTVVFDHEIWNGPGAKGLVASNPHLVNGGGTIHQADTLEALAALIGVPAENLTATVAAYNAAVTAGAPLDPPRRSDRHKPMPIATAPFYAAPLCTGITHVMGGISVDRDSRVLRPDGKPIPHLYAAGTCAGGIEGGPAIGYVGGLSKAGVAGLRAAEHIAGADAVAAAAPGATAAAAVRVEEPAAGVPAYPMLKQVVRHGGTASVATALLVLAIALYAAVAFGSVAVGVLGALVAGAVYVLMRIMVELVQLISEMLMPQ